LSCGLYQIFNIPCSDLQRVKANMAALLDLGDPLGRGGLEAEVGDAMTAEVIGGMHSTIARRKLHEEAKQARNARMAQMFAFRTGNIFVGLSDAQARMIGASHNSLISMDVGILDWFYAATNTWKVCCGL
jgi:hypothetical protein